MTLWIQPCTSIAKLLPKDGSYTAQGFTYHFDTHGNSGWWSYTATASWSGGLHRLIQRTRTDSMRLPIWTALLTEKTMTYLIIAVTAMLIDCVLSSREETQRMSDKTWDACLFPGRED
jgi:hypothetical protein